MSATTTLVRYDAMCHAIAAAHAVDEVLDLMEQPDFAFNVERLRKEAEAKLKHADALEAWSLRKFGRAA